MGTTQKEEKVRDQPGKTGQNKGNEPKDRPFTDRKPGEERTDRKTDR